MMAIHANGHRLDTIHPQTITVFMNVQTNRQIQVIFLMQAQTETIVRGRAIQIIGNTEMRAMRGVRMAMGNYMWDNIHTHYGQILQTFRHHRFILGNWGRIMMVYAMHIWNQTIPRLIITMDSTRSTTACHITR